MRLPSRFHVKMPPSSANCAANLGHCWQLVLVFFCGFSEQLGAVADQLSSLQSMNENCLWIHANDEMTLFCGGQYYGWACRKLSNKSFWVRWRNISPDQKTKKQMFRGLKIWSPRISMLFSGNHYVEEIAPACPAARLFLTCLVQLGEFPSRRLPVRHPSVWGPYALCFPGSEAQCRAALTDWLVKYGEQTYYDRLSRALQHIGRTDVAMGEYLIRGGNKHVLKSRVTGREATVLMRCKLECGRSQRRPLRKKQSWTSERIILGHGSEFAKIRVHFHWRRPPRDLDNIE